MTKTIGLVVRIGSNHNRWVVLLTDYDGPPYLCPQFFARLQSRLMEMRGEYAMKISSLDYIEILEWV